MDRKTDRDKLQIQELEWNLDQLYHIGQQDYLFSASGELLLTEACSNVSDAENRDPCNLPHVIMTTCLQAIVKLCFYACTVFACIGNIEVMHSAVLSITGLTCLTRPNLVPRPPW